MAPLLVAVLVLQVVQVLLELLHLPLVVLEVSEVLPERQGVMVQVQLAVERSLLMVEVRDSLVE